MKSHDIRPLIQQRPCQAHVHPLRLRLKLKPHRFHTGQFIFRQIGVINEQFHCRIAVQRRQLLQHSIVSFADRAQCISAGRHRCKPLHIDLPLALPHDVAVIPGLHAQQRVHAHAKRLLYPERHLRRQSSAAIHQVRQRCPPDTEHLCCARHRQPQLIEDFLSNKASRMWRPHDDLHRLLAGQW